MIQTEQTLMSLSHQTDQVVRTKGYEITKIAIQPAFIEAVISILNHSRQSLQKRLSF